MVVLVPAIQAVLKTDFVRKVIGINNGKGMSLFTASLLLGIMILPTIITVSKTSLDAVPESYYEGSLALGATHERSVFFTVLPAAKSGVMSAVILGIGRAIGETMAVVMVAGNQTWIAAGPVPGPAHHDEQHRHRDGLCRGPAPRSADRHRRGAVRFHPHHQPLLQPGERSREECLMESPPMRAAANTPAPARA